MARLLVKSGEETPVEEARRRREVDDADPDYDRGRDCGSRGDRGDRGFTYFQILANIVLCKTGNFATVIIFKYSHRK